MRQLRSIGLTALALLGALLAMVLMPGMAGAQSNGIYRVRLVTTAGNIVVALDARRAPRTVANFLAYVDDQRLDGTQFYRALRKPGAPAQGFVQGGVGTDARRMLAPLPLEPTSVTGLRHLDGVLSMAHGENADLGNCNFSIMVGPNPSLDARPGFRGYAVFGRVIEGMDVVKRILALPTGGGEGAMKGQMLLQPVRIVRAVRLDGRGHPPPEFKPWLIPRR